MDERTSRWNSNIGLFSFPPCVGEGQDGGGINIPPPLSSCMGWTHRLQTFGDIGNTFCILMAACLKGGSHGMERI